MVWRFIVKLWWLITRLVVEERRMKSKRDWMMKRKLEIHGGLEGRQGRRIIWLVGPSNIRFFLYSSIVRGQQETRHPVNNPKPQSQRFLTPTTLISTPFQRLYVSGATLRVISHSPSPPNTPHASVSQVPVMLAP